MARAALDMNYYISLSGIVTFRNAEALRDVARRVPLDRLLVETDSPYLAPVPHRGKPNEPQFVRDVAEFVAELKGVSFAQLAEQTTTNYHRLIPKAQGYFPAVLSQLWTLNREHYDTPHYSYKRFSWPITIHRRSNCG